VVGRDEVPAKVARAADRPLARPPDVPPAPLARGRSARGATRIALLAAVVFGAGVAPTSARAQTVLVDRFEGPGASRVRAMLVRALEESGVIVAGTDEARAGASAAPEPLASWLVAQARGAGAEAIITGEVSHARRRWRLEVSVRSASDGQIVGTESWAGRVIAAIHRVADNGPARLREHLERAQGAPPGETAERESAPEIASEAARPEVVAESATEPSSDRAREEEVEPEAVTEATSEIEVVTPSGLPAVEARVDDVEVGFNAIEGAHIRTSDRAWSLRIGVLFQLGVRLTSPSAPDPRAEFVSIWQSIYMLGNAVFPWLHYLALVDFAPPHPYNAWIEARPHEAFGVRLGFYRPWFTRPIITLLPFLLLFDRGDATRSFSPVGYPLGATVYGTPAGGVFEYYLGVHDGNAATNEPAGAPSAMPVVRLAVSPLGAMTYDETTAIANPRRPARFQVAVAGSFVRHVRVATATVAALTEDLWTAAADATLAVETLYLSGEIYYRNRRVEAGPTSDEIGATVTLGWMFLPPYVELAARGSLVDPNLLVQGDVRQVYDVVANFYPGGVNTLKLQLRYSLAINDAPITVGGPSAPTVISGGVPIHSGAVLAVLFF
jgi:hypothetical protein